MRVRAILLTAILLTALLLPGSAAADIDFTRYHNPAEVALEMERLVAQHPTLARIVRIGTSVEGRAINALKISDHVAADATLEGDVIVIASQHAREWLSIEMALYLAEYLLDNYATDARLRSDIDNLEIWIVPISNPDGVEHTWSSYRYWRKNRRTNADMTIGVDPNRNFSYQYGLDSGSSSDGNSDRYRGTHAFSERESQALRDLVQNVHHLRAFVNLHTYSGLYLRPWAHTPGPAPGETTLRSISDRAITRINAVHGGSYVDSISYLSSGEAGDYLWGETRTAALTHEMRTDCLVEACLGLAGFSPAAAEIIPNSEENLPAILALIHDAGSRELWIADYPGDTGAEPSAVWTDTGWSRAFWLSPDIRTDPEELNQGATVDLHVTVRNNTGAVQTDVEVEIYYTDPRISLEFPNPDAELIDERVIRVDPGETTITVPWTVPIGTNIWGERHWCVGVVIKHANDMPLTTQAERTSNIGIRNFQTTEVIEGGMMMMAATNFLGVPSELVVRVDRDALPGGWTVTLPRQPAGRVTAARSATERKAMLLGTEGHLLEPGETILLPVRVEAPPGVAPETAIEVSVHAALLPLVAGVRRPIGNGFTYRVVAAPTCASCP